MAAGVDEEPAAASVFAASIMPFSAFSLPALAGCGAASLWAVPVDMAVAEGSAVPGAAAESVDGAAPAFAAAGALAVEEVSRLLPPLEHERGGCGERRGSSPPGFPCRCPPA